jgi:hypothetical protein
MQRRLVNVLHPRAGRGGGRIRPAGQEGPGSLPGCIAGRARDRPECPGRAGGGAIRCPAWPSRGSLSGQPLTPGAGRGGAAAGFIKRCQGAARPRSSAKAADRLAATALAAELARPVVPTRGNDRAEPGATDRAFLARAVLSVCFRPGGSLSCRQLGVVLLCLERAPPGFQGFLAHGVQLRGTTSALLVVIAGFSGGGRAPQDLRSMQPTTRVLVASELAVAFAHAAGAHRRVGRQPGEVPKLVGVDPMRKHCVVRQGAQPSPIAPRTALSFDARPQPGLVDEPVTELSWHRQGPAATGPTRGEKGGLDRGWWQAETAGLPASYPGDPSSPRRRSNSPMGATPPPAGLPICTCWFTPHPPGMPPAQDPARTLRVPGPRGRRRSAGQGAWIRRQEGLGRPLEPDRAGARAERRVGRAAGARESGRGVSPAAESGRFVRPHARTVTATRQGRSRR